MSGIVYNERSWAIDVISEINKWANDRDVIIKRAGGENTINIDNINFPDVLLYGDSFAGIILQGWELKMPDTDIHNIDFIEDAYLKAKKLNLNSFLVWNVNQANLYKIVNENKKIIKTWTIGDKCKRENVQQKERYWKEVLYDILNDLCFLFENNNIKSTQNIDAITGKTISEIILNNYMEVSDYIIDYCSDNAILNDEINVWWFSARNEYEKNSNKYDTLAKLVLTSWMNKFIFANLLKKDYRTAYIINNIDEDTSINDAINIIKQISDECDFKNIFQPQLAEHCIPKITWMTLVDFNNFLIDNRLEKLDTNVVHMMLKNIVSDSKRRLYGQYPTPYNLALFLSNLTILNKNKLIFDPCCGTGTIINAAYELITTYINSNDAIKNLWASDKFKFPLQLAMLSLTNLNNSGVIHIFQEDVVNLQFNMNIEFFDPITGEIELVNLPKMDYIVSNLPFVQQEDIKKFNKSIIYDINNKIRKLTKCNELGLDGKSDLSYYIPFALWDLLNDDGKLGLILSNSWAGTHAGKVFYDILQYFFEVEFIVTSGKGKWFEEVDVITNILILKKKKNPFLLEYSSKNTTFIVLNKNIHTKSFYKNIDEICSLIRTKSDSNLFKKAEYNKKEEEQLFKLGLSRNSLFADVKWMLGISHLFIKAKEVLSIKRGERRGWDKLFYPKNHSIEQVYIKKVIKNSKELDGYLVDVEGHDAFCCDKSLDELYSLGHFGALNWIKHFENQTNNAGKPLPEVLSRPGCYWYTMKDENTAEICISINPDKRIFFSRLKELYFVNQRLIGIKIKDKNINIKLMAALLNSIIGLFFVESIGFGRGLGVLDLNATNLSNMSILNYKLLSDKDINSILKKYQLLEERDVLNLEDELKMVDRKEFDLEVLRCFGIDEYYDNIYDSLITLYNIRKSVEN